MRKQPLNFSRLIPLCLAAVFLSVCVAPARAAIGIDVNVSKDQGTASKTVATTAFSTTSGNELLLAFVGSDAASQPNVSVTGVSGAGLSWVLVSRTNAQLGTAEIWRAFSASPLSNVTVTATLSQTVQSSLTVMSFTGTDGSGANGAGSIGAIGSGNASSGGPTATLVTTRSNSLVVGAGNDYDNARARTVGAGQTLVHQYLSPSGDTYWVQGQTNSTATSGTQVTLNDTAPTSDRYNLTIVEILAPQGAGGSTFSLSGTIGPASAGTGAQVNLSSNGSSVATTTADSSGNYSFNGLANGSYSVTPSKAGFTFTPTSQTVTVNGANATGVNFSATAVTFTISGGVSPASIGSGTSLTLTSGATTIGNATGDSAGNFSFTNLSNGTYTVTPSKTGFTFTPANQPVTINGANATGVNFSATAVTFTISGNVTPASIGSGTSLALTSGGTTVGSTTGDSAGNFSFANLSNGTYTVTPSETGFTFTPANQLVTISGANPNPLSFTGAATTVSGISLVQKNGVGNESAASQISAAFASANTAGNVLVVMGSAAHPAGAPSISDSAGNVYTAAVGPVNDPNQDVDLFIWYVGNCKGGANTVTLTSSTPAALELHITEWSGMGTNIVVDQAASANGTGTSVSTGARTTTADGELVVGYGWMVNNASAGPGFTGLSLVDGDLDEYEVQAAAGSVAATFTQTTGNWVAAMATFKQGSGTAPTFTISGTILPAAGGSGATVTLTGRTNLTTNADASGNYSFSGLANGDYTVTPTKNGYTFVPVSQLVPIAGSNATGVNFTAQSNTTVAVLAIDANVSKDQGTPSKTVTSGTFSTTANNELLLAFISSDIASGSSVTVTGVTGGGLTWTLVARTNAQLGTSEVWRAFAATTLNNVTVTATVSQTVASSMTILSFTGADASGTNGSGAIGSTGTGNGRTGAPAASLVTTRNGSWVFGVGNDYDNAIARTAGTGQVLIHQNLSAVGDTYWVQRQNNTTPSSGTNVTINDTAPTTDRYNLTIVEVLPSLNGGSGGGGNPSPPVVSMTAPAATGVYGNKLIVAANATSSGSQITGVQFLLDGANLGSQVTSAPYQLSWDTTTANAGVHMLAATAFNSAGLMTTSTPIGVTIDNSNNPAVVGSWSSVVSLPAVAVNLVLLNTNKLLFYQDGSSPTVWDYINNTTIKAPAPVDLFCSGHAALADGRILVVGGYGGSGSSIGISNAEIFDPSNNGWTTIPKMSYSRWYPTATTLSDGRVIVMGGWQTSEHTNAGIPEIYDPVANTWSKMTSANNAFETYPFIHMLSDGRLVHVNGSEYATVTDILNLSTQNWSVVDANITDGGSSVMYLPDKIMKAGSAADSQNTGPSANTTFVLDMTQASPSWKQTPSMVYPRSFLNLTTLPDGTVLATGGETDKNGGNIANAVYPAELWSPLSKSWATMSAMHTPREYHGTAILLPDGRVLVSGMGADFGNVTDEKSAEFFSPPYLFKGVRPTITQTPVQISYGQNFVVETPDGASISSAVLIRTGAVTHFFDQNTHFVPVSFQQTAGGLTVTAPANSKQAPPGYYMLFIINSNGVPSVAPFVQLN